MFGHLHGVCMPAEPLVRRQSLEGAVGRILCSTEEIRNQQMRRQVESAGLPYAFSAE